MTQAYPLQWPEGWPRTPNAARQEGWSLKRATMGAAVQAIIHEVRLLKGHDLVISTNQPLRRDGLPMANRSVGSDPGVAVYFRRGAKQLVMARDAYIHIERNTRSLALAIEHLRGLERHGGATMMERAFEGFAALPPPADAPVERPWWEVLGMKPHEAEALRGFNADMKRAIVTAHYRGRAKLVHADAGGDNDAMVELNSARDRANKELGL